MARIRTIKPTIWTDDAFIELSRDARLLCIGMITQADDDGRLIASPSALIGAIYPHDDVTPKQVEKWRNEIASSGIVRLYQEGRATYAVFPKWNSHQVINKRSKSTLPAPPPSHTDTTTVTAPTTGATPVVIPHRPRGDSRPEVEVGSRREEREVEVEPSTHQGAKVAAR